MFVLIFTPRRHGIAYRRKRDDHVAVFFIVFFSSRFPLTGRVSEQPCFIIFIIHVSLDLMPFFKNNFIKIICLLNLLVFIIILSLYIFLFYTNVFHCDTDDRHRHVIITPMTNSFFRKNTINDRKWQSSRLTQPNENLPSNHNSAFTYILI